MSSGAGAGQSSPNQIAMGAQLMGVALGLLSCVLCSYILWRRRQRAAREARARVAKLPAQKQRHAQPLQQRPGQWEDGEVGVSPFAVENPLKAPGAQSPVRPPLQAQLLPLTPPWTPRAPVAAPGQPLQQRVEGGASSFTMHNPLMAHAPGRAGFAPVARAPRHWDVREDAWD